MGDEISDLSGSGDFHGQTGAWDPQRGVRREGRPQVGEEDGTTQRNAGPQPTLHGGTCLAMPQTSCGSDEPTRAHTTSGPTSISAVRIG